MCERVSTEQMKSQMKKKQKAPLLLLLLLLLLFPHHHSPIGDHPSISFDRYLIFSFVDSFIRFPFGALHTLTLLLLLLLLGLLRTVLIVANNDCYSCYYCGDFHSGPSFVVIHALRLPWILRLRTNNDPLTESHPASHGLP